MHRLVDAALALAFAELNRLGQLEPPTAEEHRGESPVSVIGGQQREHSSLPGLLFSPFMKFDVGPTDYVSEADGPHSTRRVIAFGVNRLSIGGKPVVVMQRSAQPRFGGKAAPLEILSGDTATSTISIEEFSRLILELSVLRAKVVSLAENQCQQSSGGVPVLDRPTLAAHSVILPPGPLETVVRHLIGSGID